MQPVGLGNTRILTDNAPKTCPDTARVRTISKNADNFHSQGCWVDQVGFPKQSWYVEWMKIDLVTSCHRNDWVAVRVSFNSWLPRSLGTETPTQQAPLWHTRQKANLMAIWLTCPAYYYYYCSNKSILTTLPEPPHYHYQPERACSSTLDTHHMCHWVVALHSCIHIPPYFGMFLMSHNTTIQHAYSSGLRWSWTTRCWWRDIQISRKRLAVRCQVLVLWHWHINLLSLINYLK